MQLETLWIVASSTGSFLRAIIRKGAMAPLSAIWSQAALVAIVAVLVWLYLRMRPLLPEHADAIASAAAAKEDGAETGVLPSAGSSLQPPFVEKEDLTTEDPRTKEESAESL